MKKLITILLLGSFFQAYGEGTCKKCEVLRKYHEENPNPYEYYEDYIKALKEKKEVPKKVKPEELLKKEEAATSSQSTQSDTRQDLPQKQ